MNNIELLSRLVMTMKEASLYPSQRFVKQNDIEKQNDVNNSRKNSSRIMDFGVLPDGGLYTLSYGHPFPHKGIADEEAVAEATVFKKFIPLALKSFNFFEKKSLKSLIKSLFFLNSLDLYINFAHEGLKKFFIKPERHIKVVRELYKVLTFGSTLFKNKEMAEKIRNLACYYVEYDNGYRWRGMDWANEAKGEEFIVEKEKKFLKTRFAFTLVGLSISLVFKSNRYFIPKSRPSKEIHRVLGIAMDRDYPEMSIKWKRIRSLACFMMDYSPIRYKLQKILAKVAWEDLKLKDEDIYWMTFRGASYRFLGMGTLELEAWRKEHYPGFPKIEEEEEPEDQITKIMNQGAVPAIA